MKDIRFVAIVIVNVYTLVVGNLKENSIWKTLTWMDGNIRTDVRGTVGTVTGII